jgi:SHAQKYF class myb-like DNA-binding protein
MVKGGGHRKPESVLAPNRESGEAIAKTSSTQPPNMRRNCPWTEAEHKLFLLGLEEYGRGNWRDIAARYVSTRTPTQVCSCPCARGVECLIVRQQALYKIVVLSIATMFVEGVNGGLMEVVVL